MESHEITLFFLSLFGELQLFGVFLKQVSHSFCAEHGQENPIKTSRWKLWMLADAEFGHGAMGIPNPHTFPVGHSGVF